MSWSNRASEMGPTSSRSRRCRRMSSWPAANGIKGSSPTPMAMLAPSGMNRSTASAIDITFTELLGDRFHVGAIVALELGHRVAAELLEERFGEGQRHDGLPDDAGRGHDTNVAALVVGVGLLLCLQVDRPHRLLHRRDRLDGDAQVYLLAVGDPACDAARAVGQVAEPALLVVDLVVELRAAPRRALETRAELDGFDRVDRHHRLGQPAVELAVPVHVAAQTRRHASSDDPERPTERV